jgi:hypothetical protein
MTALPVFTDTAYRTLTGYGLNLASGGPWRLEGRDETLHRSFDAYGADVTPLDVRVKLSRKDGQVVTVHEGPVTPVLASTLAGIYPGVKTWHVFPATPADIEQAHLNPGPRAELRGYDTDARILDELIRVVGPDRAHAISVLLYAREVDQAIARRDAQLTRIESSACDR